MTLKSEFASCVHSLTTFAAYCSIVYRDLKPDNIGFDVRGDLKIFDFGLARQLPDEKLDNGLYKMTGDTGSSSYMAPEVALGHPYNETADVYSFGILLHQICSLEKPFEGFTVTMFDKMVVRGGSRPKCNPKWPPRIQSLIQNCWSTNISKRPSMHDILETLREDLYEHTGSTMDQDLNDVSGKTQNSLQNLSRNGSTRSSLQ
jgi:serine/threonine protein kinase